MTNRLKLCDVCSLFISTNLHHATVLNADIPNCYTMLKVVSNLVLDCSQLHRQFNRGRHVVE